MNPVTKKVVGVLQDELSDGHSLLLRAVAELLPVDFRPAKSRDYSAFDALLVLNADHNAGLVAAAQGVPSYVAPRDLPSGGAANAKVEFGHSSEVVPYLRRQCMVDREQNNSGSLPIQTSDQILAQRNGSPIWISRKTARSACQMVAVSLPVLHEGEYLFRCLNARCFLGLLPLLNFLKQLVAVADWKSPASRACFVLDDPSLYWPSYGFINYRSLSEHARKHNYFVSIATVPLDAWWANSDVTQTLLANNPRLSLVIHGNNHLPNELVKPKTRASRLAAAAQALRRMERLKRVHGLPILKIMEAPHGALTEGMCEALLSLGYEAALCTTELLVLHNPNGVWPVTVGLNRSDFLGGGLPVLPRIKMSRDWRNDVLLKAFLGQPIIIAGHHGDASGGMEVFTQMAAMIQSLQGVTWSDLHEILLSNYLHRIEGDTCKIKMYSRRVRVSIPKGVENLCVERTWLEPGCTEKLVVASDSVTRVCHRAQGTVNRLPIPDGSEAEISSDFENVIPASAVASPRFSPWPIPRKLLMEIRDRLGPVLPFAHRCQV